MDLRSLDEGWCGFSDNDINELRKNRTTSPEVPVSSSSAERLSAPTAQLSVSQQENTEISKSTEDPQDKKNVEVDVCNSPTQSIQALEKVQREIEEKNKKKKEIVERTLKERYLRSRQESDHLKMVRNELATLDKLVTRDIEIMRKKIEESNVLYSQARKRYEVAEKEFVSAKLQLYKTREQKALLSEHLCTVIHKTELRKSKKLSQLCQALSIEVEGSNTDSEITRHEEGVVNKLDTIHIH